MRASVPVLLAVLAGPVAAAPLPPAAADLVHKSDGATSPRATAPVSDLDFAGGAWTITPAAGALEVNVTSGDGETTQVFMPAGSLEGTLDVTDRLRVYAGVYGTRYGRDVRGRTMQGELTLGIVAGNAGLAVALAGGRDAAFKLAAAGGFMAQRLTGDLSNGTLFGNHVDQATLFRTTMTGATLALQAEWRLARFVSLAPHLTGWRLLTVDQRVGQQERRVDVRGRWHGSAGLDVWIYLVPSSSSHLSLAALLAVGGDAPVTSYILSYTVAGGGPAASTEGQDPTPP